MKPAILAAAIAAAAGGAALAAGFPSLTPAQKLAAAKAAGFPVKGGIIYGECDAPADMFAIEQVDVNADGRAELIVSDGGACYGQAGKHWVLLSGQPGGSWKILLDQRGEPFVLETSHLGWKDVEIGGPGLGRTPVARWNGKAYSVR